VFVCLFVESSKENKKARLDDLGEGKKSLIRNYVRAQRHLVRKHLADRHLVNRHLVKRLLVKGIWIKDI
jgi:hypothetical protein